MQELDDIALLREYVERDSEEAFEVLVSRHINKVYSTALRHTGNRHSAEEITQAVFVILARKSHRLSRGVILYSWLYLTARLTSIAYIRGEIRRTNREQEAYMQTVLNENEPDVWKQIAPLLDAALAGLNETDRRAVMLRFFYGKSMREIGMATGATEDAVKKRVNRAMEKLRQFFAKRGVSSTTEIIAGAISANSIQVAPAALTKTATSIAIAKGAAVSSSTLTLVKGTLKLMAWTNTKTAIVVGIGILVAAGTSTLSVKTIAHHRNENVWNNIVPATDDANRNIWDWQELDKAPPAVSIRPTKFGPQDADGQGGYGKILGIYQPFDSLLSRAYGVSPCRIVPLTPLPQGDFDFIVSGKNPPTDALKQEVERKYGITSKLETRETDVLVLRVKRPNAPGLKLSASQIGPSLSDWETGHLKRSSGPSKYLAFDLEQCLQIPVIDQTGLTKRFDYDLRWDDTLEWDDTGHSHYTNPDGLKQALLNQLGLELVPTKMPIEMLVVEKAN